MNGSKNWLNTTTSSLSTFSPLHLSPQHPERLNGWWTYPYFSCPLQKWLISYSLIIPPSLKGHHHSDLSGLISIDIEITDLRVNQCHQDNRNSNDHQKEKEQHSRSGFLNHLPQDQDIAVFYDSHKCHRRHMRV